MCEPVSVCVFVCVCACVCAYQLELSAQRPTDLSLYLSTGHRQTPNTKRGSVSGFSHRLPKHRPKGGSFKEVKESKRNRGRWREGGRNKERGKRQSVSCLACKPQVCLSSRLGREQTLGANNVTLQGTRGSLACLLDRGLWSCIKQGGIL